MARLAHLSIWLAVCALIPSTLLRAAGPQSNPEQAPYRVVDGKVDKTTFLGWRAYHSACHVCHGPDATGTNVAGQGVTVRHLRGSRLYSAGVSPDTDTLLLNAVPLRAGQSLYDKYRKLNIRVLEDDSEGARVDVVWD